MNTINITFRFVEDKNKVLVFSANEGETVLETALNNDIDLQHNCGGVCGCSTCHIYIDSGADSLPTISEREEDYIDRAIDPKVNSRLACQCVVLPHTKDLQVTVPSQDFLGH